SSVNSVDISMYLYKDGDMETTDYIRAYYILDGGAQNLIGEIARVVNDGPASFDEATVTANGVNVSSANQLVIRVRMSSTNLAEVHGFDNVIVRETGSSVLTFDDIFDPTTNVSNLQVGNNSVFWNVESAL